MPSKPAGNSQGGTANTVTTQNSVQLPPWVEAAAAQTWNRANNYAASLPQYTVAPITSGGQQDITGLQNLPGTTTTAFQNAQATTQGLTGYTPQQVTPGFLSGTDLSPYMNPYTQDVINASLPLIDQSTAQSINQNADLAARTGAFGGSRQGVQDAVLQAQSGLYKGQLGAQLNQQNFLQGQAAAQSDLQRSLQAQQLNQQAGLQGAATQLGAAQQLGNLATQGQATEQQALQGAMAGQTALQQQQQQVNNAPWTDALQRLGILTGTLGSLPYGQTQTSTQTGPAPSSNPWLTGLGAAGTLAGIGGSLATIFSDRTQKTDIKKIGKDEETGLPLYAYRYKGDPKTYPKVVGIMAQDVEKKYPDQVVEVAGKLTVNADFAPVRRSFLG